MDQRQERLETIFQEALNLTGDVRFCYVRGACEGDGSLQKEVDALLEDAKPSEGLFSTVKRRSTAGNHSDSPWEEPGDLIGPYRLLEKIGEGGFASVWEAQLEPDSQQHVALKILKPGLDSRQVLSRFEMEREALKLMDHDGIAKIWDAGITGSGRPYFAMELIRGDSITQYCDDHRLSIRDRLRLFCDLCDAVQHAHHRGVMHRDIKPSNVLGAFGADVRGGEQG